VEKFYNKIQNMC